MSMTHARSPSALKRVLALASLLGLGLALGFAGPAAHAQTSGSYVQLGAQVVAPATSPTLNSIYDISGGDTIKWVEYFASRESSPWVADGEQTLPAGHTWISGQWFAPPKTSARWKVGSTWTTTEPALGTAVNAFGWTLDPMLKIDFGVTGKSVDFSGTGDGFRIIPYKKNLYVVNHHSNRRMLNCRTANNGTACPGFPSDGLGLSLHGNTGQALDTNTSHYSPHHTMEALNYSTGELFMAMSRSDGASVVVCTNLDTLTSCGSWTFGNYGWGEQLEPLETFGSQYFILSRDGKLHCFDINQRSLCGHTAYAAPGEILRVTSTQLEGKMYFASRDKVWCHDPATASPCSGWSTIGFDHGNRGGAVPIVNANGSAQGVCDSSGTYCRTATGSAFALSPAAKAYVASNSTWVPTRFGVAYSVNMNAVLGSRIYTPRGNGNGVNCFDFATDAVCTGYPQRTSQNDRAYSTRIDPTRPECLMVVGDAAIGYLFNANTFEPCPDPGNATEPKVINVNPADFYRCDPANAQVTAWDAVRVSSTLAWGGLQGLSKIKVTLRDANGNNLPEALSPVRYFNPGSYRLDISDVPFPLYPKLTVIFQMSSDGNLNSSNPVGVDVTWKGPPLQLCLQTKAPNLPACETTSTLTVTTGLVTNLGTGVETISADVVLSPGAGQKGYAAAAVATTTRALNANLSSGEVKTFLLQGRYDLLNFSGDLWALDLTSSGTLNVPGMIKASGAMMAPLSRPMYTAKPTGSQVGAMALVSLSHNNTDPAQRAALDSSLSGAYDGLGSARVNYLRGIDGSFRVRSGGALGPVINSAPIVVPQRAIAGLSETLYPGYAAYRKNVTRPYPVALWGGNDGAVHAVEVRPGAVSELWSFVPDVMLRRATKYSDPTLPGVRLNPYLVDNQPMLGHVNTSGSGQEWRTVAVVTYGRGARAITALDVTGNDLAQGKGVLFEYTNASHTDLRDLGYIVSQPIWSEALGSHQMVRLSDGRWAVLVGNGILSNDMSGGMAGSGPGRPVLYAFYLDNQVPRWRRLAVDEMLGAGAEATLSTRNGLSTPRPVDTDGDGKVDIVYAGDIQGNLWRFDVRNWAAASVSRLFKAATHQPIQAAPLAVRNPVYGACSTSSPTGCWQVIFGTGAYISPLKGAVTGAAHQLYSVLDKGDGSTATAGNLVTQPYNVAVGAANIDFRVTEGQAVDYAASKRGWTMVLGPSEHALSAPSLLANGQVRLTTVKPVSAGSSATACVPARTWLFELGPTSLRPVADTFDFNNDGTVDDSDRVKPSSSNVKRPPVAMAVAGAQYGAPATLLAAETGSSTAEVIMPSLSVDTSQSVGGAGGTDGTATGRVPTAKGLAKTGDRKTLGRMSWRLVR